MTYDLPLHHGDRVLVLDHAGRVEARGVVVGRHQTRHGPRYDVQPFAEHSLAQRLVGLPGHRLALMGGPYLAAGAARRPA